MAVCQLHKIRHNDCFARVTRSLAHLPMLFSPILTLKLMLPIPLSFLFALALSPKLQTNGLFGEQMDGGDEGGCQIEGKTALLGEVNGADPPVAARGKHWKRGIEAVEMPVEGTDGARLEGAGESNVCATSKIFARFLLQQPTRHAKLATAMTEAV